MQHNFAHVHKVIASGANRTMVLEIQSVAGKNGAPVSVIAITNTRTVPTADQVREAFAAMTEGRGRVVEGTVRHIPDPNHVVVAFAAAPNVRSVPYTEEHTKGMRAITANVMADTSDQIWNVVGTGEDRRLVLQSQDNLADLLRRRRSSMVVASSKFSHGIEFENGDFISFVHPTQGVKAYGFGLVTEGKMLAITDSEKLEITPELVLQALATSTGIPSDKFQPPLNAVEVTASLSRSKADEAIGYLREIYSSRPGLIAKYQKLVDGMAGKFDDGFTSDEQNKHVKQAM